MRRRRNLETIAGRVNSDGSIGGGGEEFRVRPNTAGRYLIDFPSSFRLIAVAVNTMANAVPCAVVTYTSASGVEIWLSTPGGVLQNTAFSFIATGYQQ